MYCTLTLSLRLATFWLRARLLHGSLREVLRTHTFGTGAERVQQCLYSTASRRMAVAAPACTRTA